MGPPHSPLIPAGPAAAAFSAHCVVGWSVQNLQIQTLRVHFLFHPFPLFLHLFPLRAIIFLSLFIPSSAAAVLLDYIQGGGVLQKTL